MSNLEKQIKKYKKQAYIDYQKASGLKVGDKVEVTRKAESFESGWTCTWTKQMDSDVGEIHVISSIEPNGTGITLDSGWCFPFFVLEKVPPTMFEVLSSDGEWRKSLNSPENIKGYEQLGSDDDYRYSHRCGLLYRIEKE